MTIERTPLSVAQPMIDWAAAHACVGAAVKAAGVLGLRVNVAVVDAGGVLAAFLRMPCANGKRALAGRAVLLFRLSGSKFLAAFYALPVTEVKG